MTREEAIKMIRAKIECMNRENSGKDLNCNSRDCDECDLCYEQGTSGEQIEALDMAIEALKEQNTGYWIKKIIPSTLGYYECKCSECGRMWQYREGWNYCPNCGALMKGE